jgi:preprotein translocase subunit YajC
MNGWPSTVLLQAEGAGGPDMSFFLMMGVIFLIFYVLVMRPQQRQQKAREEAIKAAAKGDKVVTNGGLHGVITAVGDDTVTVEIARVKGGLRVEVEVSRSGLASVAKAGGDKAEKSAEKSTDKKKEGGEGA